MSIEPNKQLFDSCVEKIEQEKDYYKSKQFATELLKSFQSIEASAKCLHQIKQRKFKSIAKKNLLAEVFSNYLSVELPRSIGDVARLVRERKIQDEDILLEIAAQYDVHQIAGVIAEFGIDEEKTRLEIAKFCIKASLGTMLPSIENFNITNPQYQVELIQVSIEASASLTCHYFEKFKLDDPVEVAKMLAKKAPESTAAYIQRWGIKDQQVLIELAKLCALYSQEGIAEYIDNFDIKDATARFEIAKICATKDGHSMVLNIQLFELDDESWLIEIAKLCAQENGSATANYIRNFGITDEEALIEIAKLCAENAVGVIQLLPNFNIKNFDALLEIIKICAQYDAETTVLAVAAYDIPQGQRVELAKLCAQCNGGDTARCIQNFKITDQNSLIEIAKICAQNDTRVPYYVWNFGITDQAALIEIAKLCVQKDAGMTAQWIDRFKIADLSALVDIAKLCAKRAGGATAASIEKFGIQDQSALIEIAELCALNDGAGLYKYLGNFHIKDPAIKLSLFRTCALHSSTLLPTLHESFDKQRFAICCYIAKAPYSEENQKLFKHRDVASALSFELKRKNPVADPYDPKFLKKQALLYVAWTLIEEQSPIIDQTIEHLTGYRNAPLALLLIEAFSKTPMKTYNVAVTPKEKPVVHLLLPMIFISQWGDRHLLEIQRSLMKLRKEFRDRNNGLEHACLLTLQDLDAIDLEPQKKQELIYKITDNLGKDKVQDLKTRLSSLRALLEYPDRLEKLELKEPTQELFRGIYDVLREDPYLQLGEVEDLGKKYLSTLATMRVPNAWKTYEMSLRFFPDSSVQEAYRKFIISVLNRESVRYENNNPHIAKILDTHPLLWEEWQKGEIQKVRLGKAQAKDFSFKEWIKEKVADGHLLSGGVEVFSGLAAYLKGESPIVEDEIEKKLIGLCENQPEELIERVNEIVESYSGREVELINDLKTLQQNLTLSWGKENWIVDTDNWEDLLLCGTEIEGSCQRVDGTPRLNVGLLGYLLDGKNRLIAIKDNESGKIIARTLFRLLWDTSNNEPALFLERMYPTPCPRELAEALLSFAKKRAVDLRCSLYAIGHKRSEHRLVSFGSNAPFEYADSAGGVIRGGVFEVVGPQLIQAVRV